MHVPRQSYTKDPKNQEKQQFLRMPILKSGEQIRMRQVRTCVDDGTITDPIVCDLEQYQLSGAKRIKELQCYGGDHRAEEAIQAVRYSRINCSLSHTFST